MTESREMARRLRNAYSQRIAGLYNVGGGPHVGSGLTIGTAAERHRNRT